MGAQGKNTAHQYKNMSVEERVKVAQELNIPLSEAAAKTAERCADAAHQRDIATVATAAQKELDKLDKELRRQVATTSPSERCTRPTPVWGPPARARPRKKRKRKKGQTSG